MNNTSIPFSISITFLSVSEKINFSCNNFIDLFKCIEIPMPDTYLLRNSVFFITLNGSKTKCKITDVEVSLPRVDKIDSPKIEIIYSITTNL